ncbi:MAG TPA: AMP phosphorylase [Methanofastidiosum sp.]|jgi:AMP phosphorylase|nr:AMP phosphorylase [Methanofastidiosum sp.]HPC80807.1 AMP phosphorylase [Methanofastidiosum sp.]HRS25057.1 AMP phosphorylase [Methanofastidiosum sp.]
MKLKVKYLDIEETQDIVFLNTNDAINERIDPGEQIVIKRSRSSFSFSAVLTKNLVDQGFIGIPIHKSKRYNYQENEVVEVYPDVNMDLVHISKKKIDGKILTNEEITKFVGGIINGNIDSIIISSFLTTTQILGTSIKEVEYLTKAMAETGTMMKFEKGPIMDVHSIGGVPGNKTALLTIPIVASAGLYIPKTSSRAITSPAGTADVVEVISPVDFSPEKLKEIVNTTGGCLAWSGVLNLSPADEKIVEVERRLHLDPEPIILASVLSKKYAMGAEFVLIDIPMGEGTKINTWESARKLASNFTELGSSLGMHVEVAVTYGGQPIGNAVGPALEVREALMALEKKQSGSLTEKAIGLAGILLELGRKAEVGKGKIMAREILESGKALEKFRDIIDAQGGQSDIKPDEIPIGKFSEAILSEDSGYITKVDNGTIIKVAKILGAPFDKGAGLLLNYKVGDRVEKDDVIVELYADSKERLLSAKKFLDFNKIFQTEGMILKRFPGLKVI